MYRQSITRTHRTALLFAIDGSGSMAEKIRFQGREMTKAEAVASVTNGMLFELIERARRNDGVRNYYDIGVIGYSGDDEVYSLLPDGRALIPVDELAAIRPAIRRELVEYRLPDGSASLREIPSPCWITPRAAGQTPMCEALRHVRDMLTTWCGDPRHAESFPPIVFNITDGEATDCDEEELCATARQIQALRTADGQVLLINIHIAANASRRIIFPTQEEADYPNRYAATLYACSSVLPEVFNEAVREIKGATALPPFRGMSFNASTEELIAMLNIGSISVKTE